MATLNIGLQCIHCMSHVYITYQTHAITTITENVGDLKKASWPCSKNKGCARHPSPINRPLALRGHVTHASFKPWVGILLTPKIDQAHKNYLTPEIWEETHSREIFYGTLIFQQSSMICIGRHVGWAYSCTPTWQPKLLLTYILLKVW